MSHKLKKFEQRSNSEIQGCEDFLEALYIISFAYFCTIAAELVSKNISDPSEKKRLFEDVKQMALEHAKMHYDFEIKSKALKMVTEKLNMVPDLDIKKVCYSTARLTYI